MTLYSYYRGQGRAGFDPLPQLQQSLQRIFIPIELQLILPKSWCVVMAATIDDLHRMAEVQHLVIEHVADCIPRHLMFVEQAADDDLIQGLVIFRL